MQVNNVSMNLSAVSSKQYPSEGYPEIALLGRSNVGKSSLINTLINRKSFARTSSTPGKTQTLNFYNIEDQLYLVDVPGYGFAKVSKKQREEFGVMIEEYLTTRDVLKGVVILVDGRHQPSEDDISMYQFVSYYHIPTLIVATKMDKVKGNQWNKTISQVKKAMQINQTDGLQLFSSDTKYGKEEVWDWIEKHM
ncbi:MULTISPECIES: ribosome biogenesis GTP-binding protein YihA/YsxC [Companilactobacillus]|jgi:ribosome biogenesis GTP-binding protein YsxC/EngB|uniref:Probable GTP-binding protein EngB n=3 Tax=Companilactobacillus TaxID=2767879 RepID=A0ABR5NWL7_9LACO|nr:MULTISPECIES: ribosome biogenesis GTP-binding protein YihA/YsxC [Companilactobacillus]KAE9561183.1 GTP-binding protein [Companilactobacillus kimchii]KAE9565498.1 GTP-binding protein [Companilactobacillus paralimentarius]KRK53239.1 GTP-binding protein YsxC [Companilactobacillus kimchii DSM 13961 = JCM 10707]MDR4933787.1 ribosome biogenesis GTP-binding protein YihA/YsxC [Companilactobacillus paralimentarius]OWF32705.1 putative GTP-binding protein EngB [Companilactobacillus kimchii]